MASKEHAEILQNMMAAADKMKTANDNLLQAIGMIAATGQITVIPNDIGWSKPVIHLPKAMYERMLEIFPTSPLGEQSE
ncbi:hypothetical protein U2P60_14705 [Brucella sp. H1_1004]|uniref:hypothetical protein n=1 Tax=Brucella sp. H1_1004 TaxID=3110109 RepID=UPI0039B3C546